LRRDFISSHTTPATAMAVSNKTIMTSLLIN
jgi:hypothetical protein